MGSLFQSIPAAMIGTTNGKAMLLYRTIAPRLFTLNPIVNKRDKAKKMQK